MRNHATHLDRQRHPRARHGRLWPSRNLTTLPPARVIALLFAVALVVAGCGATAASAGSRPATPTATAAPANAVWLVHIVAMATDSQGHLWYIRAGYSSIEEVSA